LGQSFDGALRAILAEWNSQRSFCKRVKNLKNGSGSSERLNGSFFLQKGLTFFDDEKRDCLTGSSGNNWLLMFDLDRKCYLKAGTSSTEYYTSTHCQDRNLGFLRWTHHHVLKQLEWREPGERPECQLLRRTPRLGCGSRRPCSRPASRRQCPDNKVCASSYPRL